MARLPPLNALRAFEAAGRHLSFKKAAEELCVTQGAVSRHIRLLEEHVGTHLFLRQHRQVVLTASGDQYLRDVREAFRRLHEATAALVADSDRVSLKVRVPPTFAIRWLVPRMAQFQARHPDMSVQISTPFSSLVFERDVDMAVYYPTPALPAGIVVERLFDEVLLPIVSPSIALSGPALNAPDDLRHYTLLHSMLRVHDWQQWLSAAGATQVDPWSGLKFENSALVYRGVSEGVGVAVAQVMFAADDTISGQFLAPFETCVRNDTGYFLVYPEDRLHNPAAREFRDWLLEEMERSRELARQTFPWALCAGESA